jgi:hypothetical protein
MDESPVLIPKGTPENLRPAWQPGQSGNPAGRPKSRHLTDLLGIELAKPSGKSGRSREQRMIERLVTIALTGKRAEALAAMKLIFAYTDGLPTQPIEIDFVKVVRQISAERGLSEIDTDRAVAEAKRYLEELRRADG